ncbi:E3 ubiquitin/ISG15 ligase TRIM25-like [Triplophysa rosa]|uniref:Tripartite motif-containing protein 16 n=1 Tax=Triplophysa rosa TaxID=992332 RepID=A0A9W7WX97_TRIRA|nr:E3 ubiquitin/ISG15 ligase TRIM25-like [Triplophysa rosa]KAI7810053.1 putative tripartite motif-containing protein 16 [Triplophysa rosa]
MAETNISVTQDQFTCSICLDLLKDPVTINCGHSFCMSCITDCWNQEDQKRVYSCPQCRQTFTPRPALGKNVVLAETLEKLKTTEVCRGPGDAECDVCIGRKRKAVKSCLVCLESYCQTHFECHEVFSSSKRHKVTDATGRLQKMIYSQHDRLLEVFCQTDQKCVCLLCTMDEHKNHDTVPAAAERADKEKQNAEMHRKSQTRIQEKQKEVQELREAVDAHERSAQTAVEDTERIFTELIRSIERRRSEVIQLIRDQEKTAVSRAEGLLKEREQEIDDLRRRHDEMEQLSHTEHHICFLQSFQSFSVPPESPYTSTSSSVLSFDEMEKSVSLLREKFEDFYKEIKMSTRVKSFRIILSAEPNTRDEFLQYFHLYTLDSDAVHKHLCLSDGNTVATCTDTVQQYPDHSDRFDCWPQVLCRESVCGCCYWEVEWSGSAGVGIAMSYKDISRKGRGQECKFGYYDHSWRLFCSPSGYIFSHNNKNTNVPVASSSSRIGVYVDHSAGILSFYSVADTMTLIHRVHTTFTQPLYPGFGINKDSTVKLCYVPT